MNFGCSDSVGRGVPRLQEALVSPSTQERLLNRAVATVLSAVLILNVSLVSAEKNHEEEARVAFQQGVEKFHEKDYKSAVALFRHAYDLYPTWKLYFNIGQCEAALKRYGLALDAFEAYLVAGGDEIPPERLEFVPIEIDRLTRLVGELEVVAPDGCEVMVDGVGRGKTPLPGRIRIAAGLRHVEVRQGTATVLSQKVRIMGRGKTLVEVPLESDTQSDAESDTNSDLDMELAMIGGVDTDAGEEAQLAAKVNTESPSKDSRSLLPWAWVIGGTGAALLIAGAVTGGVALSKYQDLETACPDKLCTTSADYELRGQVDSLKVATDVLLPLGAALVATGIVVTLIGLRKEKGTAFGLAPILMADSAVGLFVEGRF